MYIILLTYDYVFKRMISDYIIAYNLFKSVTKKIYHQIMYIELNPNSLSEYKKDKNSELDLKFLTKSCGIVKLEI